MEGYRKKIADKENEIIVAFNDLENQKQQNNKSPSAEMKAMIENLKAQLNEKEEQQKKLNQALNDLKGDMVDLAKNNLTSLSDERNQEKRIKDIIEKTSGEYQDKIYTLSEELANVKKELKQTSKNNDELKLELDHVKAQMSTELFIFRIKIS